MSKPLYFTAVQFYDLCKFILAPVIW